MKKMLVIMISVMMICSSVFAVGKLSVKAAPYAYEKISDNNTDVSETTDYGYGANLCYNYPLQSGLFSFGGEVTVRLYQFDNPVTIQSLKEVGALFNGAVNYHSSANDIDVFLAGKIGTTYIASDQYERIAPTLGAELGFGLILSEGFNIECSVEAQYSIFKNATSNIGYFRVSPMIGLYFYL